MNLDNNQLAFFELLRAGLWEKEARLSMFGAIDFMVVYQIAEEQSVVGLVAAGLEHVTDVKVPKEDVLQFVGSTLQLEQRNKTMNEFVGKLTEKLRKESIYALLVKGQGIAQCYERPLWRACGDVDLLLNADDYAKAKKLLIPLATDVEQEYSHFKHQGMITNEEITIPLDPQLTPAENAKKYFARYDKLKRTYETLSELTKDQIYIIR